MEGFKLSHELGIKVRCEFGFAIDKTVEQLLELRLTSSKRVVYLREADMNPSEFDMALSEADVVPSEADMAPSETDEAKAILVACSVAIEAEVEPINSSNAGNSHASEQDLDINQFSNLAKINKGDREQMKTREREFYATTTMKETTFKIFTPGLQQRYSAVWLMASLFTLLLTSGYAGVDCRVTMVPRNAVVRQGEMANFNCTTNLTSDPVVLSRVIPPAVREETIYEDGWVYESCGPRFNVSNEAAGIYILIIANVTTADAGVYFCTDNDGNGKESHTELSVFYRTPLQSKISSPEILCQAFQYRGKAYLSGRWIVFGRIVESTLNLTTESRSTSDGQNQQVTSCLNIASYRDANIEFEIYEVGGNWTSPRYSVHDGSETTTVGILTDEMSGDSGNTTTDVTFPGSLPGSRGVAVVIGIILGVLLNVILVAFLIFMRRRLLKRRRASVPCTDIEHGANYMDEKDSDWKLAQPRWKPGFNGDH